MLCDFQTFRALRAFELKNVEGVGWRKRGNGGEGSSSACNILLGQRGSEDQEQGWKVSLSRWDWIATLMRPKRHCQW